MNEREYNQLRETNWRRGLTNAEEARLREHLAAHPEAAADWADEGPLNRLLDELPEAPPVSSNFTARVLQAVQQEEAAAARASAPGIHWRGWMAVAWLRRAVALCVLAIVCAVGWHQYELNARELMARQVADMAAAVNASGPDIFRHFDPIYRLGETPPKADTELLDVMKGVR